VVAGVTLPTGRYDFAVVAKGAPCSPALLALKDVGLWDGHNYTVVANLNASGVPNLKKFGNNVSKTERGRPACSSVTPRRRPPSTCGPTAPN